MANTTNLNLPKPDAGAEDWKTDEDNVKEAIDDIGNLLALAVPMINSPEVGLIFYDGFEPPEDITLIAVSLFAQTAPTGANLTVDVLKGGAAQSNAATLTAASTHEKTVLSAGGIAFDAGQRCGLKVTAVGSTEPGNDIIATLYYRKRAI